MSSKLKSVKFSTKSENLLRSKEQATFLSAALLASSVAAGTYRSSFYNTDSSTGKGINQKSKHAFEEGAISNVYLTCCKSFCQDYNVEDLLPFT